MSEPVSEPEEVPPPHSKRTYGDYVTIQAPDTMQVFNGTATGTFAPTAAKSSIMVSFWEHDPSDAEPEPQPYWSGKATPDDTRKKWSASFDVSSINTTDGYLRVVNTYVDPDDRDEKFNLQVTSSVAVMGEAADKARAATMAEEVPSLVIQSPRHMAEVKRVFYVKGRYTPGDGHIIKVQLIPPDGDPQAVILPTLHLPNGRWVAAISTRRRGDGFKILATLTKDSEPVISHMVANILIR